MQRRHFKKLLGTPARSTFGVNAMTLGGQIEVECLAVAPLPAKRGAR